MSCFILQHFYFRLRTSILQNLHFQSLFKFLGVLTHILWKTFLQLVHRIFPHSRDIFKKGLRQRQNTFSVNSVPLEFRRIPLFGKGWMFFSLKHSIKWLRSSSLSYTIVEGSSPAAKLVAKVIEYKPQSKPFVLSLTWLTTYGKLFSSVFRRSAMHAMTCFLSVGVK